MNYSLADSLRFVRHLTTSDLDTDNVDLLHVIGEHLENLRNSGDESAKELLKEKAQSLGEWVDLNPERTFDFKLEKEEEEQKALLEERRYVRRQIEAIDRQNNEAYLMDREVRLERENNNVANRQNEIARQELVRQCAFILTQLEVEHKKFLEFVKSGEAQKVVARVEEHLGKPKAVQFQDVIDLTEASVVSGMTKVIAKEINDPNITDAERNGVYEAAKSGKELLDQLKEIRLQNPPNLNSVNKAIEASDKYHLYFLTNKEKFEKDPDTYSFYNSAIYKKFESECATIAQKMGAPDIHSKEFGEWLSNKDNKKMFLEAKIESGLTIEAALNIAETGENRKKDIENIREAVGSLKIKMDSGVITGYAKMLDDVQMKIAPMILKQVALSVSEDALLNNEHVDKEKFSILKIESPAHPGKYIEMQVYTNQPGNSVEAMRTIVSTVGEKYLTTGLDPQFLGMDPHSQEYISFVQNYISQYLGDDSTMKIKPNAANSEEVAVSKLNAVLMKMTALNTYFNENLDIANQINRAQLLGNEKLRSQLKEGLITHIKSERNDTPSDEYVNLVADKLLSGEFKSTSEFYAQEREFSRKYEKNNISSGDVEIKNNDNISELAYVDEFKNISATI